MGQYSSGNSEIGHIHIGCAGWSVPIAEKHHFPDGGSHLERYAEIFSAVEINTTFYRSHRPATYARWRDSVPETFRFSVKTPRAITHYRRLRQAGDLLAQFLDEAGNLREKLGCLLVQLPPNLRFDASVAAGFFRQLRLATQVPVACEPRHVTWFGEEAAALLEQFAIARVSADPPIVVPAVPPVRSRLSYVRLHGSPVMYESTYPDAYLDALAGKLLRQARSGHAVWCIFDNTATGAATPNALSLLVRIRAMPDMGHAARKCLTNSI
ncbi:MAG TPA: DUF72 domain-containing protein [Burkholderiaceae bacterium]|nr:DUF72 domain-containing protein [Burkholderiaceae bacterium]